MYIVCYDKSLDISSPFSHIDVQTCLILVTKPVKVARYVNKNTGSPVKITMSDKQQIKFSLTMSYAIFRTFLNQNIILVYMKFRFNWALVFYLPALSMLGFSNSSVGEGASWVCQSKED